MHAAKKTIDNGNTLAPSCYNYCRLREAVQRKTNTELFTSFPAHHHVFLFMCAKTNQHFVCEPFAC